MKTNPETLLDGYKVDHRRQYPDNATLVYSNLTARGSRVDGVEKVVFFGLQYFIKKYLIEGWNHEFFEKPKAEVLKRYKRRINNYLGPNAIGDQHIADLHDLGHLPLEIWALPEGSQVDLRVPKLVVFNTDARFFWLTNAIETILSTTIWMPCTSATTANMYRKLLNKWAEKTDPANKEFVAFQGHDFSFRGHAGLEAATMSGAAHLLSFVGTDTVPAIDFLEQYYNADSDNEMVGVSVAATEHSVMCMGGHENEVETFRRLIEDIYPSGIVSIVSDTWDFWDVINPDGGICAQLKDKIMARDGKVVIRPDSGDPVKIVTGWRDDELTVNGQRCPTTKRPISDIERKGLVQCLYEIFGGTINNHGFINLDPHIGAIYGDSITLERAEQICQRLAAKGFASTNVVYGIGSFTYQGAVTDKAIVTRDTYGYAVKSTYGEVMVNGEIRGIEIFKDPVTDDGLKKSAKGLLAVYEHDDGYTLKDQATWEEFQNCAFKCVFKDGQIKKDWTLAEIRERLQA